jgi:hypothetical protein
MVKPLSFVQVRQQPLNWLAPTADGGQCPLSVTVEQVEVLFRKALSFSMKLCGNGTVFGWGPIIALMLIGGIGIQTVYVHHITFPSLRGFLLMCAWSCVVVVIITSLFASIYIGPGYVKLKWVWTWSWFLGCSVTLPSLTMCSTGTEGC